MWRLIIGLLLVASLVGGAYFVMTYRTEIHRDEDGRLQQVTVTRQTDEPGIFFPGWSPTGPPRPTIRIATFNFGQLDEKKLANRRISDLPVRLLSRFDLIAVQDIRAADQGMLVRLVDRINATGRSYDFATALNADRDTPRHFGAFIFDKKVIEIDRSTVHSVEDPGGRFLHEPLVALFRARGPGDAEAFTFKLINVNIDPSQAAIELDLLDDVYRTVRDDRPTEDDVIMLGNFGAEFQRIGPLAAITDLTAAISATPTILNGTATIDNILFNRRATTEVTGRHGVFDLEREFDLTLQEAAEITHHRPVWAEFNPYEGGSPGHVAGVSDRKTR